MGLKDLLLEIGSSFEVFLGLALVYFYQLGVLLVCR